MVFKNLGNYHVWAGNEFRPALRDLSDEEFAQELGGRSIKQTCQHIVGALETCFLIIDKKDDKSLYEWIETASKTDLLNRWEYLDQRLGPIICEIPQGKIEVSHVSESPFELDLMDFYLQYMIHTTYHRGQLAHILRSLGKDVTGTDYLFYFVDKGS
ncbi:MAG: DinB family protein [Candidatus Thorarchaeota archaeon]|jgi:uncharacterized damage-inducible protein DinB